MDFYEVINKRFSCKKFCSKPVKEETIELILEAGRKAPTAKNLQEHSIYVICSGQLLQKIDTLIPCRYNAPLVLAITYDSNNTFIYPGGEYHSGVEDVSIVATYMMLAATNEGVDSCWVNYFEPDKVCLSLSYS